jgi:hypothetical protein
LGLNHLVRFRLALWRVVDHDRTITDIHDVDYLLGTQLSDPYVQ